MYFVAIPNMSLPQSFSEVSVLISRIRCFWFYWFCEVKEVQAQKPLFKVLAIDLRTFRYSEFVCRWWTIKEGFHDHKKHLYVLQAIIHGEDRTMHMYVQQKQALPQILLELLMAQNDWWICFKCLCAAIYTFWYLVKHLCGKLYFLIVAQDALMPALFISPYLVRYHGT